MSKKKTATPETDADVRDLSAVLKSAPPGAWVALSQDKTRVVGTGISVQAATYQAQLHGESSPVLIRTPLEDEEMAAGAS